MFLFQRNKAEMVAPEEALPGRDATMPVPERHDVLGTPITPPFPDGYESLVVGLGCFWGAERIFWKLPGVYTTAVGYAGGFTKNPSYEEVCSGRTGHTEVVLVVWDPARITRDEILLGARANGIGCGRRRDGGSARCGTGVFWCGLTGGQERDSREQT